MKKFMTLMVIPHNESQVREYRLSRPVIWSAVGIFGAFFCALVFYAAGYHILSARKASVEAMKQENTEVKRKFTFFQERLDNMRHQIDGLIEKDRMMRAFVDLSEPGSEVRKMGVGGGGLDLPEWDGLASISLGTTLTETYASMDQLLREATFLEASFDTILSRLNKDEKLRQHLPSISPVQGDYWLSSHFGYRLDPFTGRRQFHNGIDLTGWPGTPIVATANGVIETVAFDMNLGHYVKVNHGNGIQTVYGHLIKRSSRKEGEAVKRGEKIGEMGKTGRATATHVHYTVTKNGRMEDPQNYIFENRRTLARY